MTSLSLTNKIILGILGIFLLGSGYISAVIFEPHVCVLPKTGLNGISTAPEDIIESVASLRLAGDDLGTAVTPISILGKPKLVGEVSSFDDGVLKVDVQSSDGGTYDGVQYVEIPENVIISREKCSEDRSSLNEYEVGRISCDDELLKISDLTTLSGATVIIDVAVIKNSTEVIANSIIVHDN